MARLGEARGGLLAGGDVGDDALDEHAAVGLWARAGAISKRARDSVETDEPVGRLGILAAQQALVERFVERPVRGAIRDSQNAPCSTPSGSGPPIRLSMAIGDSWWT